jgi:hypothetical protein
MTIRCTWVALGALPVLLGACASPAPERFDPASQARLRVYHGASAHLIIHHGCGKTESIHAAAGGFSYLARNKTLGMPRPPSMPSFSFHEYALPAGKPVTVSMFWQMQDASGVWRRCGPSELIFTPKVGQDYETFMLVDSWSSTCKHVEVRRLVRAADGRIEFDDVPLVASTRRPLCPEQPAR